MILKALFLHGLYFIWQIVRNFLPHLHDIFIDEYFQDQKQLKEAGRKKKKKKKNVFQVSLLFFFKKLNP